MRTSLAQIGTIGKSVEAIRSDVSALKSGKRKPGSGRMIPEEKAAAAKRVWESYKARPGSENTRPTLLGAFKYGATALAKVMILDIKDFKRVCAVLRKRRQRALEREREAKKAEKTATKRTENGIIQGMRQGLKTAASIALATTCVATAPLRSEAGETPSNGEVRTCQVQGLVGISCDGIGTALPVSNQETRETDRVADCVWTMRERDEYLLELVNLDNVDARADQDVDERVLSKALVADVEKTIQALGGDDSFTRLSLRSSRVSGASWRMHGPNPSRSIKRSQHLA